LEIETAAPNGEFQQPVRRVEHFITLIRWIAFDYLTKNQGMAPREARAVLGITDVSNFKRQCARIQGIGRSAGP